MSQLARHNKLKRRPSFGVIDGVAGAWTSPRYISVPALDFRPGTRTYYCYVSQTIRRSYERYKSELITDD